MPTKLFTFFEANHSISIQTTSLDNAIKNTFTNIREYYIDYETNLLYQKKTNKWHKLIGITVEFNNQISLQTTCEIIEGKQNGKDQNSRNA